MSIKVKRGLGLLVIAAIGYLLVFAVRDSGPDGSTATSLLELVGWTLAGAGLVGGLLLLAWGLLRD